MMKFAVALLFGVVCASPARAQVSVELVLDQDQFLPGESVVVAVRVTNFSGQTLHCGKDDDWLRFNVEARNGYVVSKLGDPAVKEAFELGSSQVATKRVDIAPSFTMAKPGRYLVTATVRLPQWSQEITSKAKGFDVIAGTTLWEQDFGVPRASADKGPPEVRKYALQQAIHLKQMKLYVRVTDFTGSRVYRVFPIGPLLSFSDPEKQLDRESNLHVLYQTGARTFNFSVINPDGRLLIRNTYEYTESRPVLRADREGRIFVSGGMRRPSSDDLPALENPNSLGDDPVTPAR
jgi:hypothetical protein